MTAEGEGDRERNQVLDQGTSTTGGSRQRITSTMALGQALHRLGNELANGYRVTYTRPGSDKIKDLQVGIMAEGLTLRATLPPPSAWAPASAPSRLGSLRARWGRSTRSWLGVK